jgi:hypothetical protein
MLLPLLPKVRVFIAFVLLSATLYAEDDGASPTAVQFMRLQAFGTLTAVRPDFGDGKRNAGATVGLDLNIGQFFHRFDPSLEVRAMGSGGRANQQIVYSAGPRIEANYGRFHPYVDYLVGYGVVKFNKPANPAYTQDNSIVTSFGGGLDFALTRSWAVRVDAQSQSWDIGGATFSPLTGSVGVRYRFHFRNPRGPY